MSKLYPFKHLILVFQHFGSMVSLPSQSGHFIWGLFLVGFFFVGILFVCFCGLLFVCFCGELCRVLFIFGLGFFSGLVWSFVVAVGFGFCFCNRSSIFTLNCTRFTVQCCLYSWHWELLPLEPMMLWTPQGSCSSCHTPGAAESPERVSHCPNGLSPVLCFGQTALKWLFLCIRKEESWGCPKSRAAVPSPGQPAVFPSSSWRRRAGSSAKEPGSVPVLRVTPECPQLQVRAPPNLPSAWLSSDGVSADLSFLPQSH